MKGITNANSGLWEQGITTEKYKDQSVTTAKIADADVTRAKLNNDALYSPVVYVSDNYHVFQVEDIGKTFMPKWSRQDVTRFYLNEVPSSHMPVGTEIAIVRYNAQDVEIRIAEGLGVALTGETGIIRRRTVIKIAERYGMVALKKLYSRDDVDFDVWLLTGNYEVVEE